MKIFTKVAKQVFFFCPNVHNFLHSTASIAGVIPKSGKLTPAGHKKIGNKTLTLFKCKCCGYTKTVDPANYYRKAA